jgi:CRP/FNR family transcriptional regulator, cyclic AMP receptor protein
MTIHDALAAHAFTSGLSGQRTRSLAAIAREVHFEEDEVVLVEGEHSRSFYLLITGSVAVELRTARYSICVQSLSAGHVFGWSSLLERQDTLFQVRAREHTTALEIDGLQLKECCFGDPELGAELLHRLLTVVAGRVKATELRFAEMCGVRAG